VNNPGKSGRSRRATKTAGPSSDEETTAEAKRYRTTLYVAFLTSIAGIIAATVALYQGRQPKDGPFFIRDGELARGAEIRLLNPLLDIKLRILKDYPVEKISRSRDTAIQQITDLQTLRSVYYNLFIQSDWDEIRRLFGAIQSNRSFDFQNNDQYIESIADILDSTILIAAYLYERIHMTAAASYYYSLYLDCLRPISFSRPGSLDRILGPRLMVSRLKYYYLRDYARYESPEYAKYSYLNEMLEDRLWWIMEYKFKRYRQVMEEALPDETHFLDLIQKSDPRALPFLNYERCIYLIRESNWSEEAAEKLRQDCAIESMTARSDYLASFTMAAYIFFQARMYSARAEKMGTPDSDQFARIEQAMGSFYGRHAKEAEFLIDDMRIKYALMPGNLKEREHAFCQVAKYSFPNYDFAPYAKNTVKEKGIKCD